jgi:site-specific DNA-cytosine methylase
LRGYLEAGNKKRKGVAADAGASVDAGGLQRTVGTLCADTHPGAYSGQDAYTGRLIPAPTIGTLCARDYKGVGNQYVQEGKCIPCPAPQPFRKSKRAASTTDNETWVPADASNTLNNFDLGDTRTTHAVVQPVAWTQNQREEVRLLGDKVGAIALPGTHQTNYIAEPKVYENHPNDSRVTGPLDVAPTVVSRFGTGGGNVPLVNNEAITLQPGNLRHEAGADPSFTTSTTLKAFAGDQTPHVCYPLKDPNDIACGEDRRQNGIGNDGDPAFTLRTAVKPGVATNMAVRRLTPVETERLQGFPDNWSRIPWKGKPETECPDGPRYKACGNSMAVPVMRWIGERIAAVDATLSANA